MRVCIRCMVYVPHNATSGNAFSASTRSPTNSPLSRPRAGRPGRSADRASRRPFARLCLTSRTLPKDAALWEIVAPSPTVTDATSSDYPLVASLVCFLALLDPVHPSASVHPCSGSCRVS